MVKEGGSAAAVKSASEQKSVASPMAHLSSLLRSGAEEARERIVGWSTRITGPKGSADYWAVREIAGYIVMFGGFILMISDFSDVGAKAAAAVGRPGAFALFAGGGLLIMCAGEYIIDESLPLIGRIERHNSSN